MRGFSFKWSVFHSAAKHTSRAFIDCLSCMEETLAVGCALCRLNQGAPCPTLCVMKKANIGNCHDTRMGLSHCRNWCPARHPGIAVMSLERREEAVAGKRSSSVLVLSGWEGERQRARVIHQGQVGSCWKNWGQKRSHFPSRFLLATGVSVILDHLLVDLGSFYQFSLESEVYFCLSGEGRAPNNCFVV